jgi:hypothetical protein
MSLRGRFRIQTFRSIQPYLPADYPPVPAHLPLSETEKVEKEILREEV